jgi:hydrogenase maturation protease
MEGKAPPPRILVIGVGNAHRCDDAVGVLVAEAVQERKLSGVRVVIESGEGAGLIEHFSRAEKVILVDAVQSEGAPGAIYRFDACREKMPSRFFSYSTHEFGVAEAIEMARTLDVLPSQLIVYGLEGRSFGFGGELSPEVEQAAVQLTGNIISEIKRIR